MKEQPTPSDNLGELRRQARLNELRLKIAGQNEALAALRRSGISDSLEGFYDPANFFDPRDYLFEVPRGFGGAIPTTRNDRDEGRDFPIFRTEQELAVIRGAARVLTSASPIAVGILTTLTNYVIGNGFQYAVTTRPGGEAYFAKIAGAIIAEFLEENGWIGDLDRELFQRSRVDGEYFLGLWHVGDGHVQARAVEPDQVTEPSNKAGLDEWLGCGSSVGAPPSGGGWTFGVHTDDTDAQAIHGYYVQWTNRDTEWNYFPGGNEPITPPDGASLWMEHAKLNVVRAVKRGLSDFFPIQGNLDLARRVLRNMGEGSAVQAAIAWIQENAPGVTQAQSSSATLARADVRYTTTSAQGSRTHTAQQFDPATILKVPNGQKYLPGPLGAQNAPSFINAAEALLRTVAVRWSLPENLVTGSAENNNFASSLVAESPFVKFAESQQQFYAQRDKRTLKRVLWFAWSASRFGDVPWRLIESSVQITVTPPQIEVRDPEKETQVRAMLHSAGILSRKTWSAQEGLDYQQEQKNLAAEAAAQPISGTRSNDKRNATSLEAFDPSKHPRGNRGEFIDAAGTSGTTAASQPAAAVYPSSRTAKSVIVPEPTYLAQMAPAAAPPTARAPAAAKSGAIATPPAPPAAKTGASKPAAPTPAAARPAGNPRITWNQAKAAAQAGLGMGLQILVQNAAMAKVNPTSKEGIRAAWETGILRWIVPGLEQRIKSGEISKEFAEEIVNRAIERIRADKFDFNGASGAEIQKKIEKFRNDIEAEIKAEPAAAKAAASSAQPVASPGGGGDKDNGNPPSATGDEDERERKRYRGGRHRDTKKPIGDDLVSHHTPAAAINGLPRDDGPAIQMDAPDHLTTASHGSSQLAEEYRDRQAELIKRGEFGAAIQMDIDDIRSKFGTKYDQAIREMLQSLDARLRNGLRRDPFKPDPSAKANLESLTNAHIYV